MIFTFDIGNGAIAVCCVENGVRRAGFTLSSDRERTSEEYIVLIERLTERAGVPLAEISGAIIASVVPQLTAVVARAAECMIHRPPLVVGPGIRSGLNIRMDDPTELGGDLVAAAVSAAERYPLPCVFADMGAATALGVLDGRGSYIGGVICPGLPLALESLSRGASQLSDISLAPPRRIIGKNTRDCMLSGLIGGSAAMLDGIIDRIEEELGQPCSVVFTGENAQAVLPHCRRTPPPIWDGELVMRGLWRIYQKNL